MLNENKKKYDENRSVDIKELDLDEIYRRYQESKVSNEEDEFATPSMDLDEIYERYSKYMNIEESPSPSPVTAPTDFIMPDINKADSVVIFDTNIFVEYNAKELEKFIEVNNYKIVVPVMVMMELDYFKDNKSKPPEKRTLARLSTKLWEKLYKENILFFDRDHETPIHHETRVSNDDKIIGCCHYYAKRQKSPVIIISKDHNFRNQCRFLKNVDVRSDI